jgi:DNA-binding NarL/FixJ family response regulator
MSQRPKLSVQTISDFAATSYTRLALRLAREDSHSAGPRSGVPAAILVVEDDFLVALQVEAALTDAGFTLAGTAASGEEAISMVAAARPALVLMDIRLAGSMDGVDAALALFRDHKLRCVFATAHHDPEVRKRAAPAEPLGWLQKPYTMPALLEAVRHALADLEDDAG